MTSPLRGREGEEVQKMTIWGDVIYGWSLSIIYKLFNTSYCFQANQCADPIRKKSTNEKKRLKRKIDKWCNHHKISNKNITKGEIPMALKILKEMAP